MKQVYIIIAIFLIISSLVVSLKIFSPYPFFIVIIIEVIIYRIYARANRKKREKRGREMFQLHMRNRNTN